MKIAILGCGAMGCVYAGLLAGVGETGVKIVDDDSTVFAYQLLAGAEVDVSERLSVFAQYRYRATSDVSVDVSLVKASLDVENSSSALEAGLRYAF